MEASEDRSQELKVEILANVVPGTDIRPVGSDIPQGSKVLEKGSVLGPAELGLLATVGATKVKWVLAINPFSCTYLVQTSHHHAFVKGPPLACRGTPLDRERAAGNALANLNSVSQMVVVTFHILFPRIPLRRHSSRAPSATATRPP